MGRRRDQHEAVDAKGKDFQARDIFGAGDDADALAWEMHRRLRDAAPELERKLADVYVEFRGRLQRGVGGRS